MPVDQGGAVSESADDLARSRGVRRAVYAGWALWIALTIVASVLVLLHPARSTFIGYLGGVADWWSGLALYRPGFYGFVYFPSSALIFTPFVALGMPLADVAWRIFAVALFTYGLWRLVRLAVPRHAPIAMAAVLVLLLPSAGENVQHGQAEIAMVGCLFLAAGYVAEALWGRAALWLCVALALKPLALVPFLLYGALFRPLRRPLAIGVVVILLVPFLHPYPPYVVQQYFALVGKLVQSSSPGPYRAYDFGALLSYFGVDLPTELMTGLRVAAALATLGLAAVAVRRLSRAEASIAVLSLAIAYLMVFNPRTEIGDPMDLAAVAGLYLGVAWYRGGPGRRTALLLALLMLGLGTQAYGNWIFHATKEWLKPVLALAFFCYLAQLVLRAAQAEAAGPDADIRPGSSPGRTERLLRDPANLVLLAGLGAVLLGVVWGWPYFAGSAPGSVPAPNATYWFTLAGPEDPGPNPPSNLLINSPTQIYWGRWIDTPVALIVHVRPKPRIVSSYRMSTSPIPAQAIADMPRTWRLEGFRDGHWTVVDRRDDLKPWGVAEVRGFSVQNPGKYDRYRFVFPGRADAGLIRIYHLEIAFAG